MNTVTSPIGRYRRRLIESWPGFASQVATAKRLRISTVHYAQIESGKAGCSKEIARKITRLFARHADELGFDEFTAEQLDRLMRRAQKQYLKRRLNGRH